MKTKTPFVNVRFLRYRVLTIFCAVKTTTFDRICKSIKNKMKLELKVWCAQIGFNYNSRKNKLFKLEQVVRVFGSLSQNMHYTVAHLAHAQKLVINSGLN